MQKRQFKPQARFRSGAPHYLLESKVTCKTVLICSQEHGRKDISLKIFLCEQTIAAGTNNITTSGIITCLHALTPWPRQD